MKDIIAFKGGTYNKAVGDGVLSITDWTVTILSWLLFGIQLHQCDASEGRYDLTEVHIGFGPITFRFIIGYYPKDK